MCRSLLVSHPHATRAKNADRSRIGVPFAPRHRVPACAERLLVTVLLTNCNVAMSAGAVENGRPSEADGWRAA